MEKDERAVGEVPANCHPKIRAIHDYWRRIHPETGLPGRQHFDPIDIPALLPHICLIDASGPQQEYVFRLMGTKLVNFFGADFTGKPFVTAYNKATQALAYKDLRAMQTDHKVRWRRGRASLVQNREYVIVERIYLPFAQDGRTVNLMLGLLLAKYGDKDFD